MNQEITIKSTAGDFAAFLAKPDGNGKYPGLVVIHEVWGLKDHIKDVAARYAAQGYFALAPDLLSHTGITEKVDQSILVEVRNPATRDEAQKKLRAAMAPIQAPEFGQQTVEKLKACVDYLLAQPECSGKVGVVGFCFGGTYAYALAVNENRLSAAVVFYGHAPANIQDIEKINCPVLVFNGEKDENLMKQLSSVKEAAQKFGKEFAFYEYPETGHAFFNDT